MACLMMSVAGCTEDLQVSARGVGGGVDFVRNSYLWKCGNASARPMVDGAWGSIHHSRGVLSSVRGVHRFHVLLTLRRGKERFSSGGVICNAVTSPLPSVTKTERTLALPIDFYQILGVEAHFQSDAIVRAYEARLNHPPRDGLSNEALMARLEILRGARDTLADPELRGDYNQGLAEDEAETLVVDVPWSKVAGALCLLQEVGEMELVLQAGQALITERLPKTMQRDVVLVMALAYVELSREAMAEATPTVIQSCDLLEIALKLLQDEGGASLAPILQEQIEEALEELTPRCVLELLALPLDKDHETLREEGLQGLRAILWAVGEGGATAPIKGFTREQFMKEAFTCMTAAEQVALWTSTPDNIPTESSEVYTAALSHVAEGFNGKKPYLIVDADELFWQIQILNGSDYDSNVPMDYSLERSMCKLLLGQVEQSMSWLGLEEDSSESRDPSVVEFVYLHSEGSEDGDVLPGLCMLLESWLAEVVFPTFRDTSAQQIILGDYYDDTGVVSYLEQLERKTGGSSEALSRIGAALDNVKASAIRTLQKVFPLGKRTAATESASTNSLKPEPENGESIKDSFPSGFHYRASGNESSQLLPSDVSSNLLYLDPSGYGQGDEESGTGSNISIGEDQGQVLTSNQSADQQMTLIQIACSGILFGALVMTGLHYFPVQNGIARFSQKATTNTVATPAEEQLKEEVIKMDARLAEQMVRKWQIAKAHALGPTHSVHCLPEVLEGQMLESWTERVNEVARNGWYWEYRLVGLNVDSVTVSDDGRRAMVEATLQEAARLFDSKFPEHKDSYRSTYTTRYEFLYGKNGWKITGGVVLRS